MQTRRVSDFKVVEAFLRAVSNKLDVPFVDVGVEFRDFPLLSQEASYDGQSILVGEADLLGQTLLAITANYLSAIDYITGREIKIAEADESRILLGAAAVIRDFMYGTNASASAIQPPVPEMSLSQFPFVWLLMRDIVCPQQGVELRDLPVLVQSSARDDAVVLIKRAASPDVEPEPVLVVNADVMSDTTRYAYMVVRTMEAYGLDVRRAVSDLLAYGPVLTKVAGLAKLAFSSEAAAAEFSNVLSVVSGLLLGSLKYANTISQQSAEGLPFGLGGAWVVPQLLESMIDPARGPDKSTTEILAPITQRIWNRVSEEKARLGKADMSLEDMLRAQSKPFRVKPNVLLQELLSAERVW